MYRICLLILLFAFSIPIIAQQNDAQSLTCPADFAGYLAPRLVVDEWARVTDTPLNFRPIPGTSQARLDQLTPGTTIRVVDGPLCNEGYVWWQVDTAGTAGWLAEGSLSEGDYWLEPRGELIQQTGLDNINRFYVLHQDEDMLFLEPADCKRPPEDYTREQLGYATLNRRTLAMLDQAQHVYDGLRPEGLVNFRQLITQGSYNTGGVAASFGTHDAGGAVDIAVRSPLDWSIMESEIPYMIESLRIAGFAAWLRNIGSLYPDSPIHIHAIAVGDAELSPDARLQIDSERGYLHGFNGLPEDYGAQPIPDEHDGPVICYWMWQDGWRDMRDWSAEDYLMQGQLAEQQSLFAEAIIAYNMALLIDPQNLEAQQLRQQTLTELGVTSP